MSVTAPFAPCVVAGNRSGSVLLISRDETGEPVQPIYLTLSEARALLNSLTVSISVVDARIKE